MFLPGAARPSGCNGRERERMLKEAVPAAKESPASRAACFPAHQLKLQRYMQRPVLNPTRPPSTLGPEKADGARTWPLAPASAQDFHTNPILLAKFVLSTVSDSELHSLMVI